MRLHEIEHGEKLPIQDDRQDIIKMLNSQCSEIIQAMKASNKFLYRGVRGYSDPNFPEQFKGKSRSDRKTMGTSSWHQPVMDKILANNGFAALRGNSIFCTSNIEDSTTYGRPYIIFPINGFDFTWSPVYQDLYGDPAYSHDMDEKAISKMLSHGSYKWNDLPKALQTGHEIMIHGEYYAFRNSIYDAFFMNQFIQRVV